MLKRVYRCLTAASKRGVSRTSAWAKPEYDSPSFQCGCTSFAVVQAWSQRAERVCPSSHDISKPIQASRCGLHVALPRTGRCENRTRARNFAWLQPTVDDTIQPRSSLLATNWRCKKTKSYQRLEFFLSQLLMATPPHESCTA